jgi:hypothetical protein
VHRLDRSFGDVSASENHHQQDCRQHSAHNASSSGRANRVRS